MSSGSCGGGGYPARARAIAHVAHTPTRADTPTMACQLRPGPVRVWAALSGWQRWVVAGVAAMANPLTRTLVTFKYVRWWRQNESRKMEYM